VLEDAFKRGDLRDAPALPKEQVMGDPGGSQLLLLVGENGKAFPVA